MIILKKCYQLPKYNTLNMLQNGTNKTMDYIKITLTRIIKYIL